MFKIVSGKLEPAICFHPFSPASLSKKSSSSDISAYFCKKTALTLHEPLNGNKGKTADVLKIDRSTLYRLLKKYEI